MDLVKAVVIRVPSAAEFEWLLSLLSTFDTNQLSTCLPNLWSDVVKEIRALEG